MQDKSYPAGLLSSTLASGTQAMDSQDMNTSHSDLKVCTNKVGTGLSMPYQMMWERHCLTQLEVCQTPIEQARHANPLPQAMSLLASQESIFNSLNDETLPDTTDQDRSIIGMPQGTPSNGMSIVRVISVCQIQGLI